MPSAPRQSIPSSCDSSLCAHQLLSGMYMSSHGALDQAGQMLFQQCGVASEEAYTPFQSCGMAMGPHMVPLPICCSGTSLMTVGTVGVDVDVDNHYSSAQAG
jgi:hypothetical protein